MSEQDDDDEAVYEVGYGKPPRDYQFKPGQSGNPRGRKPKSRNSSTLLMGMLDESYPVQENGRCRKLPMREIILRQFLQKAAKGDLKAAKYIYELSKDKEEDIGYAEEEEERQQKRQLEDELEDEGNEE